MLSKKIIVLFVLGFSLLGFPTKDFADNTEINPLDLTPEQQVIYFSDLYGGDYRVALKVMECESGGNHKTTGDGGLSNGIFQFQKSTFLRMEREFGEDLNYTSQFDQIKLASWALSQPEKAREWTTYVSIEKGGKYHFWSSQNKRYFTVYCKL